MGDVIEILTTATNTVEVEAQGPQGIPGVGVPTGGSTGQVLRKASGANYDTEWATGGGGGVSSWNDLEDKPSTFTPSAHKTSHSIGGTDALSPFDIGAAPATGIDPTAISGTAVVDSDPRLSDSRTPTAHASSHAAGGADELFDQSLNQADSVTFSSINTADVFCAGLEASNGSDFASFGPTIGLEFGGPNAATNKDTARTNLGLEIGTDVAAASHSHGNLTSDGKVGSVSGLPVVTTTSGAITTLALGTANQVLKVNSGATGVEFGTVSSGDTVSIDSTAADILSATSGAISADDAGADRIVYWNNTSNKLAYGTASDVGAAAASHTHAASDIASGTIDTARLGSGTANNTTYLRGDSTWAEVTAGVGGGSGSVDNAILRADGTGGSTVQSSDINIEDATTSTQNNVQISNQHSGQTNSALVLTPKGTGAFIVGARPTGAATTGNARGANATDLQQVRSAATQVASGTRSGIMCGTLNTNAGLDAFLGGGDSCSINNNGSYAFIGGGDGNSVTSYAGSVVGGYSNLVSNQYATAWGYDNTASGVSSTAFGIRALSDRESLLAISSGRFASDGDAQIIRAVLRGKTTTNSAVELFMGLSSNIRLTVASGKVMAMLINITGVKSDGSAVAHYVRQYAIKNVGGTTSEVYAAATVGTDNAASTSITLSANDTNDALKIECTGIASETWRWVASVDAVEVAYGT